jgi:hypothetical protein
VAGLIVPRYTESIDAALMLVPEGWAWSVYRCAGGGAGAGISPTNPYDEWAHTDEGSWAWSVYRCAGGGAGAGISPTNPHDEWAHTEEGGVDAAAATPAIALVIACLKAKEDTKA